MTNYLELRREHARLAILRFLEGAPRYTSNASMIGGLLPRVGIDYTRDQVETEFAWLEEQGLATLERHPNLTVATATLRGVEVAQGIARHPGIQRPRPGQ